MRQFLTSNIWSMGMMPATFFKEQVFNMCEKLADASIWNEVIVRFQKKYGKESLDFKNKEKIRPIVERILGEIEDELDKDRESLLNNIIDLAIQRKNISSSTSEILHKLYPLRFDWKSWGLYKMEAYYQIVFAGFNELKVILGEDLNHLLIHKGIRRIISNMGNIHKQTNMKNGKFLDYVILLYPVGLVDGRRCFEIEHEKKYLYWGLERISKEKFGREHDDETIYSYINLATEILVESFFESGEYQYDDGYVSLRNDDIEDEDMDTPTVAEDILNHFNFIDFSDMSISDEKIPLAETTKKALDRIDKTFDITRKNIEDLWGINIGSELSNGKKEVLIILYLMYKYSRFEICENGTVAKKNIFHILKHPSYENSLTGLLDGVARNANILFALKSDLLKYILDYEDLKSKAFQAEEIVARVYLDFNARIEEIKDAFLIKGLRAGSFHDVDNIISMALSDKDDILKHIQSELHDMYKGTVSFPREDNLLVFIYLKICESEYNGILRDMELLFKNIENWIIESSDSATELLLKKQCDLEKEEYVDFIDCLKSHSSVIAEIIDPDNTEKSAKDIRRYAERCFCIWQAALDWYPLSDWEKNNKAYADFGTMVAIVQLERQLRKGKISIKYLSAYKGDNGKELTVRFREELPEDRIAVEIIMNLLFLQILSNFGLHKSIQVALRIILLYIAQYKGILSSDSIIELDEQRQEYAQDAKLPQVISTHRNICRAKNAANELYQEEIQKH